MNADKDRRHDDAHGTPPDRKVADAKAGKPSLLLTAIITVLITIAFMVMSALTGGYGAYSQAERENAQTVSVTLPIIVHLFTVIPALVIGGFLLMRGKKGDWLHRILGRTYAALLLITAIISFWIGRPGTGIAGSGFSFLHIFAVWTLFAIPWAVHAARCGNIARHESAMRGLYIGLIIAGCFSLLPGRFLGHIVF